VTVVVLGEPAEVADALVRLVDAGRSTATPVAVTAHGTTTAQRTLTTTLEQAPGLLEDTSLSAPLMAVVGLPVGLHEQLSWFETKPLFGWRVLVPRTKDQAGTTTSRLQAFGAVSDVVPTISVEPPRTPQQMERAVKGMVTGRYEWVGFTSVNAVRAVREKFEEFGLDARAFAGLKVAAVGGVTAQALRTWGIQPDLVPSAEQSAQGLLAEWPPFDEVLDPINRVFLPRADIATDTLVAGLQEVGWEVDDVTAYRTVRAAPPAAPIREAIKAGAFDAVVFTSSSTVRNLVGIAGKPHPATVVACIGPATAKTAEEHGLRVDVLSPEPTSAALVEALAEYGASLRMAALEAGEPVVRPSERKTSSRRRAR
jgi:uroporphyrinogen III methyltransferase/synthase